MNYTITVLDKAGKLTTIVVTAKDDDEAEKIAARYGRIIAITTTA